MRLALALLAAVAAAAASAPRASAAITWAPCTPAGYECSHLAVALDPSGAAGGVVTLAVKRVVAPANPTHTAVVGLAGGPGQAAIPFATKIQENIAPALASRDLIVFDQRGTGLSGRLRCRAFESRGLTIADATAACAREIGPARAFYRTPESVEDIEAIRREGGYERLVLYGTSYGTKVAEAYAARYPARVESLVLDSVVLPEGPDVFDRSTFQRIGPALRQMCGTSRCRGISGDPRGDLAALVRRVERTPLQGPVTTPSGRIVRRTLGAVALFDILISGDFDPTLRADLPAAVRGALRGDPRPLLRLQARAERGGTEDDSIAEALFATTACEEARFPWDRGADPRARAAAAVGASLAVPRAQFGPFDADVALVADIVPLCVGWPNAAPAPDPPAPLPPVPALILSGGADLRTPLTDARALAARLPGARLLEVPFAGHSVIGADPTGCAKAGVAAFFAGAPIAPCTVTAPQFAPTRIPPTSLARVAGAGRARKTINAAQATFADVAELFLGDAVARRKAPRVGTRFGGLRGGTARWTATGISLRDVEYVPGVVVSGFAPHAAGATTVLRVAGPAAAHGAIRVLAGGRIVATLDGRRITTRARPSGAAARAATGPWPQGFRAAPGVVRHQ